MSELLRKCQSLNGFGPSPQLGEVTDWEPLSVLKDSGCFNSEMALVVKICSGSSLKGADIRPNNANGSSAHWPLKPLPAGLWKCTNVIAYTFNHRHGPEHINALESRAYLSMSKWRTNQKRFHHFRILHLLGSWLCLWVLAKGRTSSQKLAPKFRPCSFSRMSSRLEPTWTLKTRYDKAFESWLKWHSHHYESLPSRNFDFDVKISDFIEAMWKRERVDHL